MYVKISFPSSLAFLFIIFASFQALYAQRYTTALGIRVPLNDEYIGLTLQQKIKGRTTVEVIAEFSPTSTRVNALLESHIPIMGGNRFNVYLGAGPQAGIQKKLPSFAGAAGVAGVELTVGRIAASVDFRPVFNFSSDRALPFYQPQYGFSARYVLIKQQHRRLKELRDKSDSIR